MCDDGWLFVVLVMEYVFEYLLLWLFGCNVVGVFFIMMVDNWFIVVDFDVVCMLVFDVYLFGLDVVYGEVVFGEVMFCDGMIVFCGWFGLIGWIIVYVLLWVDVVVVIGVWVGVFVVVLLFVIVVMWLLFVLFYWCVFVLVYVCFVCVFDSEDLCCSVIGMVFVGIGFVLLFDCCVMFVSDVLV